MLRDRVEKEPPVSLSWAMVVSGSQEPTASVTLKEFRESPRWSSVVHLQQRLNDAGMEPLDVSLQYLSLFVPPRLGPS